MQEQIIAGKILTKQVSQMYVKNREQLLSHGLAEAREMAVEIIEACLEAVDPYKAVIDQIKINDDILYFDENKIDLKKFDKIYVLGAGKATYKVARAIDEIFSGRIHQGLVVLKDTDEKELKNIRMIKGRHPYPDESSFIAGEEIEKIIKKVKKNDLVISLITGGSSALCTIPVEGVSRKDKIEINKLLVTSGADILEINTVRRHLSKIKGGYLTSSVAPATVISLTVSDEKRDISCWNHDWTAPDNSTFADAVTVLKKYKLWELTPESIKKYLRNGNNDNETPKNITEGQDIYYKMVVKTVDLWEAARRRALELGLTPQLLTTVLTGDSLSAGRFLASVGISAKINNLPLSPPCMFFVTGETSVRLESSKKYGTGGADQELSLGGCIDLTEDEKNILICSVDTDGTDGPTDIAGGMTDYSTINRVSKAGTDFYELLDSHSSSEILKASGDFILTGTTGTNVNSFSFVIVLKDA